MIDSELLKRGVEVGKKLLSLGTPAPFAAAMAGNSMLESGARTINPSKDGSDGLWQWRDAANISRLSRLKQFSAHYGVDWRDETIQCKFAIYECENDFPTLWEMRTSNRSVATLTLDFCDQFERPAPSGRVPDLRIEYAEAVYKEIASAQIASPVEATVPPSTNASSDGGAPAIIFAPAGVQPAQNAPSNQELPFMPAILLADVLPLLAPILSKVVVALIKELEATNPGMSPVLKQLFSDVSAAL